LFSIGEPYPVRGAVAAPVLGSALSHLDAIAPKNLLDAISAAKLVLLEYAEVLAIAIREPGPTTQLLDVSLERRVGFNQPSKLLILGHKSVHQHPIGQFHRLSFT
jgi:hypothetical protein